MRPRAELQRILYEEAITIVMRSRRETWQCPSALGMALLIASAKAANETKIPGVDAPGI